MLCAVRLCWHVGSVIFGIILMDFSVFLYDTLYNNMHIGGEML